MVVNVIFFAYSSRAQNEAAKKTRDSAANGGLMYHNGLSNKVKAKAFRLLMLILENGRS